MNFILRQKILWIILLAVFFAVIYTVHLSSIPTSVHNDEAETALQAEDIIQTKYLFGAGWAEIPRIAYWPHAISMMIFGRNVAGNRLGSVIFGLLTLPVFYLLMRLYYRRDISVIAVVLLGTSHVWLAMTRLGIIYTQAAFFVVLTIYTLLAATEKRKVGWFIVAGICLGLAMYSYYAVRILPVLTLFFLFIYVVRSLSRKTALAHVFVYIMCALDIVMPLGMMYIKQPEVFSARTRSVSIFEQSVGPELEQKRGLIPVLRSQVTDTFNIFNGDTGGQYGYKGQVFDYFTLALFFVGLFYALRHFNKVHVLFIAWLGICIAAQVVTTSPSPFFVPRFVVGLPVFYIFAAIGTTYFLPHSKIQPGILAVVGAIVVINLYTYFIAYPSAPYGDRNARAGEKIAKYLNAVSVSSPEPFEAIFLTEPSLYASCATIEFLSPQTTRINVPDPAAYMADPENFSFSTDVRRMYIVYPQYKQFLDQLKVRFPRGKSETFYDIDDFPLFYSFSEY